MTVRRRLGAGRKKETIKELHALGVKVTQEKVRTKFKIRFVEGIEGKLMVFGWIERGRMNECDWHCSC